MKNQSTNKNWIPVWFKLYKELNQPVHIHASKINIRTGETQYLPFDHAETDGFGVALNVFRQDGWKIQLPQRTPRRVPFFIKLLSILKYPYWARIRQVKWRQFDKENNKELGPFSHRFTGEETQRILNWCKANDTNLNSFLLWTANKICKEQLAHTSNTTAIWWIPVDMRPFLPADNVSGNQSSHIAVEVSSQDTPSQVRKIIRKKLKNLDYIGAWWWLQIGNFIGEDGMRKILKRQIETNRWSGTLTNLGKWPIEGMIPPVDYSFAMVGTPPAPVGHPLALGTVVFYDELYVSASINQCILKEERDGKTYFEKWVNCIQETSAGISLPLP